MRKILVVIDMQNDFIDGALGTKEAAQIVPNVVAKMRGYAAKDIFATQDTHEENYLETQEGRHLPVPHCLRGTHGWQIREEVAAQLKSEHIVEKPAFGSTKLAEVLAAEVEKGGSAASTEIEIVGLCTDICVVSNALIIKAALPEVSVSVDSSCCAGVTPEKHAAALETLRSCQIAVA